MVILYGEHDGFCPFYDPYHGIQLGCKNNHDDFYWFVWTECPGKWSCADGSEPVIPYLGGSMWISTLWWTNIAMENGYL